ncbi:MAG: DNA helicase RecQ [Hyphomonadaceae bacterium]|nr:DNA helicase RecQ [Hyphomonadaceae bacterium]
MSAPASSAAPHDALIEARAALRRVFGHEDFRGLQADVIAELLAGRDALAILPTGGGKSVCYQIPAILGEGCALVVSPLIALMADQVAALRAAGVAADRLDSSRAPDERSATLNAAREGRLKLLYVSPESLMNGAVAERLQRARLSLIAIDEAHCVSQWGHDFRPDYRQLGKLADLFPGVPRIAVTATADPKTQADIRTQLRMDAARLFVASFDRPNLALAAERKEGGVKKRVVELVRARAGRCGVVYAATRDGVEEIAEALTEAGVSALAYHAGLAADVRAARQATFQTADDAVMVATIAFGMGVDKPDVRFVIHADPPKSIEAYWQEVGRAGRDGEPAEGVALYGAGDLRRSLMWAQNSDADADVQAVQMRKARQLFALFESMSCRRAGVRRYFGETDAHACGACDICLDPPAAIDATQWAAKALSAVIRMQERVGRGRVIDHLMGKPPRDGLDERFIAQSTYGVGKDVDQRTWRRVIEHLLFDGLLIEEDGDRPTLRIGDGERVRRIFRNEESVRMRAEAPKSARAAKADKRGASAAFAGADAALFQALRAWRREAAAKAGAPPYVIFHDQTLADITRQKPESLRALGAISGIGEAKLAKYGEAVLEVLRTRAGEA